MDERTLALLQRFRAEAIQASAIRNQGAKDVLCTVRTYLRGLKLSKFVVATKDGFGARLDMATVELQAKLPTGAKNWGTARKALNLFLRDCAYDHHLRERYRLERIEHWLEVPLDRDVAAGLRKEREGEALPGWKSEKGLTAQPCRDYQTIAQRVADRMDIRRVDLDLYYWRRKRGKKCVRLDPVVEGNAFQEER